MPTPIFVTGSKTTNRRRVQNEGAGVRPGCLEMTRFIVVPMLENDGVKTSYILALSRRKRAI